MRRISFLFLMAVVVSTSMAPVYGQGNSDRRLRRPAQRESVDVDVDIVFGSGELRLIRSWFGDSRNFEGLPPGLSKRNTLPAGLQRQLQKNGTLPPGLQQHVHGVPSDLNVRLPTLIAGISRVIIGGSILLVDDSNSRILDIAAIF